jgi:hypothetical protein
MQVIILHTDEFADESADTSREFSFGVWYVIRLIHVSPKVSTMSLFVLVLSTFSLSYRFLRRFMNWQVS